MTTITILPEKEDSYRALAGDKESTGRTAGEALDALTPQLSDEEGGTLIIVQNFKPDEFFSATQRKRLAELMQLRQTRTLSSEEQEELETLIGAELDGARRRTEATLRQRQRGEDSFTSSALAHREISSLIFSGTTDREMQLLYLHFGEELSPKEIAAALNQDVDKTRYEINKVVAKIRYRARKIASQMSKREEGESTSILQPDEPEA